MCQKFIKNTFFGSEIYEIETIALNSFTELLAFEFLYTLCFFSSISEVEENKRTRRSQFIRQTG